MSLGERFDFLLNDSSLQTKKELSDLLHLCRDIRKENIELQRDNNHLRRDEKKLKQVVLHHLYSDFGGTIAVGLCAFSLLVSLALGTASVILSDSSGDYSLLYDDSKDCTQVVQVVEWGADYTVSECFKTSTEARDFMFTLPISESNE